MLQTTELRDVASNVAMHKLFNDLIDKLENVLPLFFVAAASTYYVTNTLHLLNLAFRIIC